MTEGDSGFFVVHLNGGNQSAYRTETAVVVNNTVITIVHILSQAGISGESIFAYDQGIDSLQAIKRQITSDITQYLQQTSGVAYALFTVLTYNAQETIVFVQELQQEFAYRIKIVLGGQLVTQLDAIAQEYNVVNPYLKYADIVGVGDGEVILPLILSDMHNGGAKNLYRGFLGDASGGDGLKAGRFTTINSDDVARLQGINQRLIQMMEVAGFTMLSIQGKGGPGCRWAIKSPQGPCSFCALTAITISNSTPLENLIRQSFDLSKQYELDMVFDVANQFIPHGAHERKEYLRQYLCIVEKLEKEYNISRPHMFAYVTLSSLLEEETVNLLYEIGVRQVYVGLEHLSDDMTTIQGKPVKRNTLAMTKKGLKNAMKYGIKVNGGFVLGSKGETQESLSFLFENLEGLIRDQQVYRDGGGLGGLMQLGFYPVELIPGSGDYASFMRDAYHGDLRWAGTETKLLFEKYLDTGYITREEQHFLTASFINNYSTVSAQQVFAMRDQLIVLSHVYGLIGYGVDDGDNQEKLESHWG